MSKKIGPTTFADGVKNAVADAVPMMGLTTIGIFAGGCLSSEAQKHFPGVSPDLLLWSVMFPLGLTGVFAGVKICANNRANRNPILDMQPGFTSMVAVRERQETLAGMGGYALGFLLAAPAVAAGTLAGSAYATDYITSKIEQVSVIDGKDINEGLNTQSSPPPLTLQ